MATQIPSMTVVAVDASNKVLGAGGTAGTEVRQRQIILRAVSSAGKVIESDGTAGSVNANPPVAAVRIVNASNAIIKSDGTASAATAQPDMVAMFVGSDNVGYGSSGSGIPVMDVHVVDETSTLLDVLFGGSVSATEAVTFDGSTGFFDAGLMTGSPTTSRVGTLSFWFKLNGGNGTNMYAFSLNNTGVTRVVSFWRDSSNVWQILVRNDGGASDKVTMQSNSTYTADSTWHHFAASWDVTTVANFLYIDGSSDKAAGDFANNNDLGYGFVDRTTVGCNDGSAFFNGDLAYLYFNESAAIDFSVAANLQKFRSAGGAPVDLGSDGSTPTGSQPILYLHGLVSAWPTNKGSGGNFTATGTITQAPSDPP